MATAIRLGATPFSPRPNIAMRAIACMPSPALIACAGPQCHHTDGRPARSVFPSSMSLWISQKLFIISTEMAWFIAGR